jgi:hypothetical protein
MSTTNKNLVIPSNNTYINNWDIPMNTNFTGIDYALGGVCYISATGRSGVLNMIGTYSSTYPYPPNNVGSSISPVVSPNAPSYIPSNMVITGSLLANLYLTLPAGICGQWSIGNYTTEATGVNLYFGVSGQTPLEIPNGGRSMVVSDGTTVSFAQTAEIIPTTNQTPIGAIVMWFSSIAAIPTGWHLCNGDTVTMTGYGSVTLPDLRDKFIIGASQDSTGIAKTNITGSLTVSGGDKDSYLITHDHVLNDPQHTHTLHSGNHGNGLYGNVVYGGNGSQQGGSLGGGGGQVWSDTFNALYASTGVTMNTAGTVADGTNRNLPPYYALAYIIRIS